MHEEKHFRSSDTIRDIVIGMSDGLTVPFALAAGLSGAVQHNTIIITAGMAEIVAGSIAMGLGGYLAAKTDADFYAAELKREYDEVEHLPEVEKKEIREILAEYGISANSQTLFVDELAKDKDKWVDFMMKFELGLEQPHVNRARFSAGTIAASYIVGGLVPLGAYFFTSTPKEGLPYSIVVTLIALFIFGYLKNKAIGQSPLDGAVKTTIIGAIAAAAAFFIARLVSGG
jgi:vacuolar iron transporter family protein